MSMTVFDFAFSFFFAKNDKDTLVRLLFFSISHFESLIILFYVRGVSPSTEKRYGVKTRHHTERQYVLYWGPLN